LDRPNVIRNLSAIPTEWDFFAAYRWALHLNDDGRTAPTVAPQSLATAVQETVKALDRTVPVSNVVSMDQVVVDTLWQPRFNLQLIGLFAGVALVLAAIVYTALWRIQLPNARTKSGCAWRWERNAAT